MKNSLITYSITESLINLSKKNKKIIVLDADLADDLKLYDFQKKFPKIYKLFKSLHEKDIDPKDPIQNTVNVTSKLGELFSRLVFSNKQSAKSTAGSMLEHHIETLLNECKYNYDYQESIVEGEVLDFIFPNIKSF